MQQEMRTQWKLTFMPSLSATDICLRDLAMSSKLSARESGGKRFVRMEGRAVLSSQ